MSDEEPQEVDAAKVVGFQGEAHQVSYTKRDLLLYALGIGCKNTPEELPFIYEDHEQFAAFPTFPLVLPFKGTSHDVVPFPGPTLFALPPGLPIVNPAMILHAEQSLHIVKPLDTDGAELQIQSKIVGLYDKGKGALLRDETRFLDAQGETVAVTISGSFIRGLSGFDSLGPPLPALPKPPSRSPDHVSEEATSAEQALVYRLSGDYNSLHADPEIAAAVGFDRPILHGLCTFGHAARAVVAAYAQDRPHSLRSITARFSKPAFPGETLVTHMWALDDRRVMFRTTVKERDVMVLDGGMAEFGDAGEGQGQARL